jgi:hypothetical protein
MRPKLLKTILCFLLFGLAACSDANGSAQGGGSENGGGGRIRVGVPF